MTVAGDDHHEDQVERVRIELPSARSVVWLGLKVYLMVVLGIPLAGMAAALLVGALVAATR